MRQKAKGNFDFRRKSYLHLIHIFGKKSVVVGSNNVYKILLYNN